MDSLIITLYARRILSLSRSERVIVFAMLVGIVLIVYLAYRWVYKKKIQEGLIKKAKENSQKNQKTNK